MSAGPANAVLRHVFRAAFLHQVADLTDGQLLECFLARRDQAAFEALVKRHGPMVLSVCRRVLGHAQDAEDAFQATFLVLVRKAASVVPRQNVGNWLYGVAYRTALEARASAARRRAKERRVSRMLSCEVIDEQFCHELHSILDQELSRLPDKYRAPLVLCDLEGKTRKEAARQLGWRDGTLSWRLAKARVLLGERLTRRGIALSGGLLCAALAQSAVAASVPAPLVARTVEAATMLSGSVTAAGVISGKVLALTEGVLKTMLMTKLKVATTVALFVAVIGTGAGGYAYRLQAADEQSARQTGQVAVPVAEHGQPEAPRRTAEKPRLRQAVEDAVRQLTKALEDDARIEAKRAYGKALQDHRSYLVKNCTACHQVGPPVKEDDPHGAWRLQYEQYLNWMQSKPQLQDKNAREANVDSIKNAVDVLKRTTKDAQSLEALKEIETAVKKLKQGVPGKR